MKAVRYHYAIAALLLSGCSSPAPAPRAPATEDPTRVAAYGSDVTQVAALCREAEQLFRQRRNDEAAKLIQKGEALSQRLLAVAKPTLAAVEAASDMDDLYGRMLLANRHYAYARLQFQKNLARWKHWQPQTQESARRLQAAESAIALCDRNLK